MRQTIQLVTLGVILLSSSACHTATLAPTPTTQPSATHEPTLTPMPTPTHTPLARITPIPPTLTATRLPTPAPTRIPATATITRVLPPPVIWDSRLDILGIRVESAKVQGGQAYWRLIRAEFWDEKENQGKHHIFVNVLDETGARVVNQEILVEWPGETHIIITAEKPAPEYSANFPLDVNHYPPWGTLGVFDVRVNGLPSDKVVGMGLPPKNKFVVYLLTFQRARGVN